ncbi:MAG: fibronectin type III domain-containing protein [Elusimicrobiota bacterium]
MNPDFFSKLMRTIRRVPCLAAFILGAAFFAPVQAGNPGEVQEEGTLEIAIAEDFENHISRTVYMMKARDGRLFTLDLGDRIPNAAAGSKIKVRGRIRNGVITVPPHDSGGFMVTEPASSQESGSAAETTALTTRKVLVLMLNFTNDRSEPFSIDMVRRAFFTNADSSDNFYKEQSFGKVGLAGKLNAEGDIYGWYKINSDNTGCNILSWVSAANSAADAAGVNRTGYGSVVYMWPRTGCSFSGMAGIGSNWVYLNPPTTSTEKSLSALLTHEVGHNFGAWHASAYECTENGSKVAYSNPGNCSYGGTSKYIQGYNLEYGDRAMMGGGYYHMNAYHKWALGYIPTSNILTWSSDGDYILAPLEKASNGLQVIRIPSGGQYIYVEHRQAYGFDSTSPLKDGVSLRFGGPVDSSNNNRPKLIDTRPETAAFTDAALGVGKTFHNKIDNFYVQVLDISASGATVRIKRGAPPAGDTTPPTISSVAAGSISSSGATITWSTNEASDSQVEYGLTTSYGSVTSLNTAMVTSHSAALSGLQAGKTYNYRVKSKDAAGNLAVSGNFTFTTSGATADTTAPTISSVAAGSITSNSATITWTTNEASDSQVQYGTTTAYGSATAINTSMVTAHSMALSGLQAGKTYNYRVKSRDAAGNLATSGNFTFTTTGGTADTTPPAISAVSAGSLTSNSAAIKWTTNEASNSQVQYGTTTAYGSATAINTSMVTAHSMNLTGLLAGKTYNYRVKSRDAAGNLAVSGNFTFATPATTPPPAAPASLTAYPSQVDGIDLGWTDNSTNESGFKIERKAYGTTAYAQIATTGVNIRTYRDTAAVPGAVYYYRVRAYNSGGNSAYSNEALTRGYMAKGVGAGMSSEKFLSPGLADGINDVALFGPEAREVAILDVNGREVFRAASDGIRPIVWDCRGNDGLVPSGAYIAKITDEDGGTSYQTLAVVK